MTSAPSDGHESEPLTAGPGQLTAWAHLQPCELYKDHGSARPVMTEWHHVYPMYLQRRKWGAVLDNETMIYLCGNCHDAVHAWTYYLMGDRRHPGPTPLRAQALAQRAVDWFNAP